MTSTFKTEDQNEALRIIKSIDTVDCLYEIVTTIRRKHTKYSDYNDEQQKVADNIFEEINDCINYYNINLEELSKKNN